MIVLGIDPGYALMGWGVVKSEGSQMQLVAYGCIETKAGVPMQNRLRTLQLGVRDLLSIYKHNQKLLHKTGDAVKAGTPVAMLASSSSLTKGDHLHFELWYKGTAVDPVRYIKF